VSEALTQAEIDALLAAIDPGDERYSACPEPEERSLDDRVHEAMSALPPVAVAILERWLTNQQLATADVSTLCAILRPVLDETPNARLQILLRRVPNNILAAVTRHGSTVIRTRIESNVSRNRRTLIADDQRCLENMSVESIRCCFATLISLLGGATRKRRFV
jgi:hypothetical protein